MGRFMCQGGYSAMARRNGGAQGAHRVETEEPAESTVERRWGKVQGRIGKLERQVQKLEDCVTADGERLPADERARLKLEISRLAVRLHEAAERRLDEIADRL